MYLFGSRLVTLILHHLFNVVQKTENREKVSPSFIATKSNE